MKCITWNIEWANAKSSRGLFIKRVVEYESPDVICFTESTLGMVPKNGYMIESESDYGYKNPRNRRKVILWSSTPWQKTDSMGCESLPGGRFVTGITHGIRFIGVCIPWRDAHVRTGRKDRTPWQDHRAYLRGLEVIIQRCATAIYPICVTGDFNQKIPRSRQPVDVAQHLDCALDIGFQVATSGVEDEEGKQLIDHVALSDGLTGEVQTVIPKTSPDGMHLSDHSGIVARVELQSSSSVM